MTKSHYTSYDELPLALSAEDVAAVLGISRAQAYCVMRSKGFPTLRVGKRLTVQKQDLLAWMRERVESNK